MKYKRIKLSAELLLSLFHAGPHPERSYDVIKDAIPADAKFINVRHLWPNDIELLIESATFPAVKHGEEIPLVMPTIKSDRSPFPLPESER